ncbi:MAG: hypothetical protein KAR42_08490 [candidate division Zixibacteria bacterium]|nr:hypothetical protein [candidate division Zixibacteria bacterium]
MKLSNNQEGSVLITALIMIAVLLILFLSAFSYGIARYGVHVKNHHATQAMYLAESGINRFVHLLNTYDRDLKSTMKDSVHSEIEGVGKYFVSARPYGGYLLLRSEGISGSQKKVRYALLGALQRSLTDNALTVLDSRFPIVATGRTRINGDIYSAHIQLTTGQIDGKGIIDKIFHSGRRVIVDSISSPYKQFTVINDYIHYVYQNLEPNAHKVSTSMQITTDDSYFDDKTVLSIHGNLELNDFSIRRNVDPLTIIVSGFVEIKGKSNIQGLVEIISEKFIRISDSSVYSGGILFAEDSILIKDNSYFSAQAITQHVLNITDLCEIAYPSLLLADNNSLSDRGDYSIRISTSIPVNANILYISSDTLRQRDNEVLKIDSNATVIGVVYSSDYIDLHGNVDGSVIANNFKFEIPPTTYINWLKDVRINRYALDYTPILPITYHDSANYRVILTRSFNE